ncbi:glycosyltransferase family 1 protein [Prolixibacter sp. NT017]|uniref:glycosyltransferase family 4 protein n=1 Tax=Prolixibacter sp. NT017 TaxID=2652390 RepID=UPI001279CC50|nr:glycosyltransferase family 1 protein [Prolixibacter sp. NT017]GET27420.1 glycosyl transferase family 1 [Prolixibacter sp. NT017]
MNIVVNTRLLLPGKLEGIGRFTHETLRRITTNHPEHRFFFLFDRPYSREFIYSSNVTPIVFGPSARHPLLWYLWFERVVPRALKGLNAHLFLSTDGFASLRTNVPQTLVIHDLSFEHRPYDLRFSHRWFQHHFVPRYAKKAQRLVTVSGFSRDDLMQKYHIPESKIDIVPNGVSDMFHPLSVPAIRKVREKYTGGRPYFLFVGALQPRKNVAGLLRAYDQFCQQSNAEIDLLIVGGAMHKTREISRAHRSMKCGNHVHFTGRVTDVELVQMLGAALALTFVPFFEGFGIPVIEAMAAGVPVICSNSSSLPEVGGESVCYVEPDSIDEIAAAMMKIYTNQEYAGELILSGKRRSENYTWERSAELLWESMMKTIEHPS